MQGQSRVDRELLDAQVMVGELVPQGSVFAFLAEHRHELFPDSFIADLFRSSTGRPSLPADLVGSVLVLKELFDLSDTQTAEALKFDIRWKVACGRSLTAMSFDPSTLVYWRRRIAASERPDRVFDAVAEVITETGILTGRRKRCVDSTVFDDAVATQDTVTQLVAAIRKVARVVPGAAEVIGRVAALDYSRPGKPAIDWDDPQAKQNLVSDLVNDALAVLVELTGENTPEREDKAADALGLLALVAGQDVEPAEDSDGTDGRWRIARKVAADRVISTVDVETRHTRKSKSNRRDGFRGHVAAEPETGLITDCELTKASGEAGSDPVVGEQMISRDRYHRVDVDVDVDVDAVSWPQSADEEKVSAEPVADSDAAPTAADGEAATTDADAADNPQPDAADEQQGRGLQVYGDSAYGTGEGPCRLPGRRARHGDQAQTAAPGRGRRIHPRRLHGRRGRWHRHLPRRAQQADEPKADGDLRPGMRRLPAPIPVHHSARRPFDDHPPARGVAAGRPRPGPHSAVQAGLSHPLDR
ncbi:transposase [Rhodococcus opacus]|nr:transposase [Rhodococcus opacus]